MDNRQKIAAALDSAATYLASGDLARAAEVLATMPALCEEATRSGELLAPAAIAQAQQLVAECNARATTLRSKLMREMTTLSHSQRARQIYRRRD